MQEYFIIEGTQTYIKKFMDNSSQKINIHIKTVRSYSDNSSRFLCNKTIGNIA